jgi:hypothetical protein
MEHRQEPAMDFIITKEQQRMQKAAREMLKAKCTNEFVWEMEKDAKGCTPEFPRNMKGSAPDFSIWS